MKEKNQSENTLQSLKVHCQRLLNCPASCGLPRLYRLVNYSDQLLPHILDLIEL